MNTKKFDEHHVLHELKHYLPSQLALKDFVHHNSLHAYQDKAFYEAIFSASKTFGFQVTFNLNEYRKLYHQGRISEKILARLILEKKGESGVKDWTFKMLEQKYQASFEPRIGRIRANWKQVYHLDIDTLVQPTLFRIIVSYLDQGIALWHFPFEDQGLINAIKIIEENAFTSFFKTKQARKLLFSDDLSMEKLLGILVGKEEYYAQYIYDQQFAHRGWSGLVAAIEGNHNTLLYQKKVSLHDFILLELLLEIDALNKELGTKWSALGAKIVDQPMDYFSAYELSEQDQVLALWQDAFEWTYYDEVLNALSYLAKNKKPAEIKEKSFQAIFCIDDRECSIRRHVEYCDPLSETLGAPGFFGVAIYFQPFGGKFYEKNCPVPITPRHLIKEVESSGIRHRDILQSKDSHTFFKGLLLSLSLGVWAASKLAMDLFRPKMRPDISDAFAHMNIDGKLTIESVDASHTENGLQIGFQVDEMVEVVYNLLKGIGMTDHFAPMVYVIAHGSSSANNPHHGAYDCGACSGRPGSVNARVFSSMANHPKVRAKLAEQGMVIPDGTQFVGAMHDTASDEIAFYDDKNLTVENEKRYQRHKAIFEKALDLNAKERARRFVSINITKDIKHVRNAIKQRSVSYFEPRPELGHGTNALCYVGYRETIRGLFLDRRAFLNSYDYRKDPDGEALLQVMKPLPVVCGGINLEYYFSRMDVEKMGAGTKLSHNVMGLIGVSNSSDGDLRPGLPLQMIEVHDPVRLLLIIEHRPEIVLKVIQSSNAMYDWFDKGWIHLVALSPDDNTLYHFNNGKFNEYSSLNEKLNTTEDSIALVEKTQEIETNHIPDATKENIPVHLY